MAYRHSTFQDFEEDPFFIGAPRHSSMMGFPVRPSQMMMPRDPFQSLSLFGREDPFARMHSMFANFERMSQQLQEMPSSNSHCYSQSSVMHFSNVPGENGQPRIYQATSSTRSGPGGIKESRKAVKDSHTGIQKMAVSHQIGERSHTIEKKYNAKTKEREEHQELVNLDESDAPAFNKEWENKTKSFQSDTHQLGSPRSRYPEIRALPSSSSSQDHSTHHHSRPHPYSRIQATAPFSNQGDVTLEDGRAKKKRSHQVKFT